MTDSQWWNNTADRKPEYDRLWNKYVPSMGFTEDIPCKVLVCASKILYDIFNNGGCNLNCNYGDYVETLEGHGIDMDWLREHVDFDYGDGEYLDDDFINGCSHDVDYMMEQALDVAISCETENSAKIIHELESIRDRAVGEIDGLIDNIKSLRSDDPDEKHWNDEGNKRLHAMWLEECLPRLIQEALECGGCTQEQLSKVEWDSHAEHMKAMKAKR